MDSSLITALKAKISELQATLAQAAAEGQKLNEAQTEYVVINPLLSALGYGPLEVHNQGYDAVTQSIPDYILLPNSPHKWFFGSQKAGPDTKGRGSASSRQLCRFARVGMGCADQWAHLVLL